uniref:DEP domain-containing protein n=1 Tax=Parastrongyloides trichosuri TaxID=131310 RepID=A0A0N4ZF46_PARTI
MTAFHIVKKLRDSVFMSSFASESSNNRLSVYSMEQKEQLISQRDIDGLKSGKFRQTRSFVIIGRLFKYGVPRTTHIKLLKTYKDSFTGREAVRYLMTNIVPRVYDPKPGTDYRNISIALLSYFLREGFIIELGKNINDESFKDSVSRIYCINENYNFPEVPYDFASESHRFDQSNFSTRKAFSYVPQRMVSLSEMEDSGFNGSAPIDSPQLSPNAKNVIENIVPEFINSTMEDCETPRRWTKKNFNRSHSESIPEEIELSGEYDTSPVRKISMPSYNNTITYPSTSYSNLVLVNSDKVCETVHSNTSRSRTSVILYTDQDNFEILYDSDTASDSGEREIIDKVGQNGHSLTHEMIYGVALRGFLREIVGSEVRRKLLKQLNYSCSDLRRNLENVDKCQVVNIDTEIDLFPQILNVINGENGGIKDLSDYDSLLHLIEADQFDHFNGNGYLPPDFSRLILKMAFFYKSENRKVRLMLKDSKHNGRHILKEFKPCITQFLESLSPLFDWKGEENCFLFEKDYNKLLGGGRLTCDIEEEDGDEFLDLIASILLLLPSYIRRRLQLLVRFMVEVEEHPMIKLKAQVPNRYFLLRDFSNILIHQNERVPETACIWITSFFLDNYSRVFTFPSKIQATVSALHKTSPTRSKTCHEDGKLCTGHDCYQCFQYVNKQLRTQLTYIISNPNITATARKKELETFKSRYPYIYYEVFPKSTSKLYSFVKFVKGRFSK